MIIMVLQDNLELADELDTIIRKLEEAKRSDTDINEIIRLKEDFKEIYMRLFSCSSYHADRNVRGVDKKEMNVWAVHPLSNRLMGIKDHDSRIRSLLDYMRREDVNGILVSDAEAYVRGEHLIIDEGICGEVIFTYYRSGTPILPLEENFIDEKITLIDIAKHHFVGGCYANRCVRQFSDQLRARSGKLPHIMDNWVVPFYLD